MEESNQTENQARIVKPELSINKKLGNIKFETAFDATVVHNAEKVVEKSAEDFKANTLEDYEKLKGLFSEITPENLTSDAYHSVSSIAFSIKSRAGLGGMPIASEIANLLFKFCDVAAKSLPAEGFRVLKVYFESLSQILEGKFAANDDIRTAKLMKGLEEISKKFSVQ